MFHFTIRDVLWLMVVVGMGVGWFLNDRSWRRLQAVHREFNLKEAMRLLHANLELEVEIQSLLRQHGETDKLQERLQRYKHDPEAQKIR